MPACMLVIDGVGFLKSLAQRSFNALSQHDFQCLLVGNVNPAQACVVWLSSNIVACYHANGCMNFTEEDVANPTRRQDININQTHG